MFTRHSSLALCAAALLVQPSFALARAQAVGSAQILPADLPACAQTCTVLQQAVSTCQSNPAAANTCFCQSALLVQLPQSNANVCVGQCSDPDFETIRSWYRNFCADPANPGGGQQNTAPAPTTPDTIAVQPPPDQAQPPSTNTEPPSYLTNPNVSDPESGSEWWSNHWEWVLMVIILVIGFSAIGIGGSIWYKRRQRRKEGWDDPRPEMSAWAPNQHNIHDLDAPAAAATAGGRRSKGKDRETPIGNPVKGSKLKKILGRA